jgi:NAD(P)H-dependent flavin oxidoreductase YrpB (nitropropane dioxygenase family)
VEAGTSDTVRQMLAEAEQADVAMAPSADMFELGVKVQVLKR